MSNLQRRFEILMPLRFNDGTPIPQELFAKTALDLRKHFGVWPIRTLFEASVRMFIDVPDAAENKQYFREFKEKLKERFQLIEIRITTYLIEVC